MRVWNPVTGQMEEVPGLGYDPGSGGVDMSTGEASQMKLPSLGTVAGVGADVLSLFSPTAGMMAKGALAVRQEGKEGIERDKLKEAEANKAIGLTPEGKPSGEMPGLSLAAPPPPPIPATVSATTRTLKAKGEDEALAGIKSEKEKEAQAEEKKGQILADVQKSQAEGLKEKAAAGEQNATNLQAAADQGNAEIQKARDKFTAEQDKYSKMEIPDYYAGRTGKRVYDAVMMGLGELGAILAKTGHNSAKDIIIGQQQDWYAQEKAKIEKQFKTVGMAKDQIGAVEAAKREKLNDLNIVATAKMTALADKIEAKGKEIGTPYAIEESKRVAAAARGEGQKSALQAVEGLRTKVTTEPNPAARAGGANNDRSVYGEGGQPIALTRTPEQAKKANSAIAAYRQLDGVLAQLEQSYQQDGRVLNPLSEAASKRKALQSAATIAYKNAAELGALSGPDMGLVEQGIGGGTMGNLAPDTALAKLRAARASGRSSHAAALDSLGLPGAQIARSMVAGGGQPTGKGGPLTDRDKEALNWANAHRDDPRAKQILAAHGL